MALAAARACLKEQVSSDLSDDRADALGSVASALVEAFAPSAPQLVKNEATLRTAGWLHGSPADDVTDETVGPLSVNRRLGSRNALRNSGASGLLSAWRVAGATVIE